MVKHVLGNCDTNFGICCIVGFVYINVLNLERDLMEKKDPEDELEDLDDELYWREEMMGEHPYLNPIGDPYHPDGL